MVIANFVKGETIKRVFGVWQYNYGQTLRIQGLALPPAVEVHFSLQNTGGETTTRIGVTKDGVTDVVIPDSFLENGDTTQDYEIYAFVYIRNETSGQTEYKITINVTSRSKPEAFDRPEDAEIFKEVIKAVNESAARSAESEKQAEGWAHGREDLPERAQDNAKYYSEQASVSAEEVKKVEQSVKDMVATVDGIDQQVQDVKGYAGQAKTAAEKALLSEQEAKKSEEASLQHRTGAETAENNAEVAEQNAKKSERAVEQAKQLVMQMGQQVLDNKNHVDGKVEAFNRVVTDAVDTVGTVKTDAVNAIGTKGTEQTQKVADEGAKQVKAVEDKGNEVLQSIPPDFATQMESKLNKQQGVENKGKALVVGEDGNVVPGEMQSGGGDGIAITNTMNGASPLVIPDSAERVNKGIGLTGKTEQVQTTGKNLANPSEFVIGTLAGDDGNVINLKQYISTGYIPVIQGKRYSTSGGNKFSSHTIIAYDKEKTKINTAINMSSEMPEGAAYIRLSYRKIDMTNVTESDMEELKKVCMVNEGSTVLSYEPYTGGKPSPSPECPQEIKSVGKWNPETQKYEVDIKVTNAKESWDKEQTITLTSDRPITKWDKLVEQDGQIGWLYQSNAKEYIGNSTVAIYNTGFYFGLSDKKIVNGEGGYCKELKQYVRTGENPCIAFNMAANAYVYTLNTQAIYGSTVSAIKEYLKTHPLHIVYKTEIPEFVPLPQSEQDAIRALMTYYPTTVITADGGEVDPDIELTYIADTKNYIDQKLEAIGKSVVATQMALL